MPENDEIRNYILPLILVYATISHACLRLEKVEYLAWNEWKSKV